MTHNKKRNVGIIYELLLRHVSSCLVDGRNSEAQKSLDILQKRFSPDTELYREFRLFNALAKSTVSSSAVAAAIMTEAKNATRRSDQKLLNREKSLLIKEINYTLNDPKFYHRRILDYKMYATIHILLNEWRKEDRSNLSETVIYESKVINHLLSEKDLDSDLENHVNPDIDSLVVKILTEKFNKKYGDKLNTNQKNLIKSYVFSLDGESESLKFKNTLEDIKNRTLNRIVEFKKETDSEILLEKIEDVKSTVQSLPVVDIDDDVISKYLVVSHLSHTLMGEI